jgi:hypothetical protein
LGYGIIAPRILNFSFTPRPLYLQGKSAWYPLDRRLGEPQSRSGRGGEDRNSQPLPGSETPIVQPIAQRFTTEDAYKSNLSESYFQEAIIQSSKRKKYSNTKT